VTIKKYPDGFTKILPVLFWNHGSRHLATRVRKIMGGWLFYALLALVSWGLWGVFSKVAATHLPSWAIFLVEIFVYLLVGSFIWGLLRTPVAWTFPGLAAAVAAGLCGGWGLFFFLKALASGPAAVVVPMTSLYPVITVALGVTFLQESLTVRHLAGIILAAVAVWLLSK
jgi:bacterial/archaeal transporter family protein